MDIFETLAEIERERDIPERLIGIRSSEWPTVRRVVGASEERENKLELSIAREFGTRHGWRLSTFFTLHSLRWGKVYDINTHRHVGRTYDVDNKHVWPMKFVDHPQYYRRDRRAAALVCHIYVPPFEEASFNRWAVSNNLTLYLPDLPSWYNNRTRLVVYLGTVGRVSLGTGHPIGGWTR